MSTEFYKNISNWRYDCTDNKNDLDFFLRLVKWPKIAVKKKPNFSEVLGTKVVQFWCYTKSIMTKNVPLNWYFSMKFFLERFEWFLMLKIAFENQILALFDGYFWPHEKIKSIFVISAFIPSIWNVFIKFRWHDEKLTLAYVKYHFLNLPSMLSFICIIA